MGNGNILVPLDRVEDVEKKIDELNTDLVKTTLIRDTYKNIDKAGKYYLSLSCTDKPSSGACFVSVLDHPSDTNYLSAMAIEIDTNKVFTATRNNGVWSDWTKMALDSDLANYDLVNAKANLLDNTVHACVTHNTSIDVSVPNLSNYRYIQVNGGCGDAKGSYSLMFENRKGSNVMHFVSNMSGISHCAFAKVTCDFNNNKVGILPQVNGWGANTVAITSIYGFLPVG